MMMRKTLLLMLAAGASTALAGEPTVSFELIPGDALSANDMSPDGRFIVGELDQNGDNFPDGTYLWDRVAEQFTVLPPEGLTAMAVSDDGTVVLGEMPDPADPHPQLGVLAARWTAATGWVPIGHLPNALDCPSKSDGYELSGDGSVAVGLSWDGCSGRGFVWTAATGMLELQPLANGGNRASVISVDGSVIAGFAQGTFNRTPAVWDASTQTGMTTDPTGDMQGEWTGISDDGSVLLGSIYMGGTDGRYDAVRQDHNGPLEVIGDGTLLPGWTGIAMDMAESDGTIVGFDILFPTRRAWIQPRGVGDLVLLSDWATQRGATIGDTLGVPQMITPDGRFIIGHTYGFGAWLLTITPSACMADLTGSADPNDPGFGVPDGLLDANDFFYYLGLFADGDSAADLTGSVDPNDPGFGVPDGTIDANDFFFYLDLFANGCQ